MHFKNAKDNPKLFSQTFLCIQENVCAIKVLKICLHNNVSSFAIFPNVMQYTFKNHYFQIHKTVIAKLLQS
jgi:hypothetical protein